MIVALSITSESCDSYLLLFKDKTVEEIKDELYSRGQEFYGASVEYEGLDFVGNEEDKLIDMLNTFRNDSWEFDEYDGEFNCDCEDDCDCYEDYEDDEE